MTDSRLLAMKKFVRCGGVQIEMMNHNGRRRRDVQRPVAGIVTLSTQKKPGRWSAFQWLLLCVTAIAVSGCGSTLYTHPLSVNPDASSSAEVTFFRESRLMGILVGLTVYLDNRPLVSLRNGTFVKVYLAPGIYTMRVGEFHESGGFTAAVRKVRFASGRAYFIILEPGSEGPFMAMQPRLIDAKKAAALKAVLTPFGGATVDADRYPDRPDDRLPMLERVEWVVDDLEAAEAGVTFPPSTAGEKDKLPALMLEVKNYSKDHPREISALILLARLARLSSMSQPVVFGQPLAGGVSASEAETLLSQADGALGRALALEPERADVYYWDARLRGIRMPVEREGRIRFEARDLKEAIRSATKSVELSPQTVDYRKALALLLVESGRFDEAREVMQQVAGGRHPIYQLLEDRRLLPVPPEAVDSPPDTENFAKQQMERKRISDYPTLRVRYMVLPMTSDQVADFYRRRWPSFRLKLEDHDTLPKGGESFVYVSYFIKLKGALQPSAHTPEGADGSRDGIYLAVIELRNAPMEAIGETAAGFKIPFKSSTLCYLLIVDYYSYE